MTVGELRTILACYDDDTPVLDGKGYELPLHAVFPSTVDIWTDEKDSEGYETPLVGVAVSIGRRF